MDQWRKSCVSREQLWNFLGLTCVALYVPTQMGTHERPPLALFGLAWLGYLGCQGIGVMLVQHSLKRREGLVIRPQGEERETNAAGRV